MKIKTKIHLNETAATSNSVLLNVRCFAKMEKTGKKLRQITLYSNVKRLDVVQKMHGKNCIKVEKAAAVWKKKSLKNLWCDSIKKIWRMEKKSVDVNVQEREYTTQWAYFYTIFNQENVSITSLCDHSSSHWKR